MNKHPGQVEMGPKPSLEEAIWLAVPAKTGPSLLLWLVRPRYLFTRTSNSAARSLAGWASFGELA